MSKFKKKKKLILFASQALGSKDLKMINVCNPQEKVLAGGGLTSQTPTPKACFCRKQQAFHHPRKIIASTPKMDA